MMIRKRTPDELAKLMRLYKRYYSEFMQRDLRHFSATLKLREILVFHKMVYPDIYKKAKDLLKEREA